MPNPIKCTIWTINIKHRDLGKGMLFFLLKEISQKEAVLPPHLEIETKFLFSVSHKNYPISIDFWWAGSSTWTAFKISQQLGPLQYWISNNSVVNGFQRQFEMAGQVMYVLENVVAALPTPPSSAGVHKELPFYLLMYILGKNY